MRQQNAIARIECYWIGLTFNRDPRISRYKGKVFDAAVDIERDRPPPAEIISAYDIRVRLEK